MNRPIVSRDDFWADLVNAFFLRSVYRTPTSPRQAESHHDAVPSEEERSNPKSRSRRSENETEDTATLLTDDDVAPSPYSDAKSEPEGLGPNPTSGDREKLDFDSSTGENKAVRDKFRLERSLLRNSQSALMRGKYREARRDANRVIDRLNAATSDYPAGLMSQAVYILERSTIAIAKAKFLIPKKEPAHESPARRTVAKRVENDSSDEVAEAVAEEPVDSGLPPSEDRSKDRRHRD